MFGVYGAAGALLDVSDVFPSGVIDAVGESREVTLSRAPSGGEVTIAWSRSVSCSINAGQGFDSATASIELTIEKDTGGGYLTITTRSYSASVSGSGSQSDSDSGPDSVDHTDTALEAGSRLRIRVTALSESPGSTGSASALADPDAADYKT